MLTEPLQFAWEQGPRFVSELKDFLRFPRVSAQPKRAPDLRDCAAWRADHLQRIGLDNIRVVPTRRHPIVYAESRRAPGKPTVLIYGHYDVQPADPLSEWRSPPFEPAVRGESLYGRGASHDKGQLFVHVKAIECYFRTEERLPRNARCVFEGEEEIGSPNLPHFLHCRRESPAADIAVLSDTRMLARDRPAVTYALRGVLSPELTVCGAGTDLHSGTFGGALHNPLQALCEIIAGLHDTHRNVAISGSYDRVRAAGDDERHYLARTGPSDAEALRDARAEHGWGESGCTLYKRTALGMPTVLMGFALPDDGMHAPNEKFHLPTFNQCIATSLWFLHEMGLLSRAALAVQEQGMLTNRVGAT
jgi:acetylornithine deacetylase/succinyl-diaminopimelate desuccinylase-like protein